MCQNNLIIKSGFFLFVTLSSICFLFSTCKKQNEKYILEAKIDLLTKDTLIYDEQILWWNSSSQMVTFKKENTSNNNELKEAWFKYEMDGSFTAALSNGYVYSGNWEFLNNGTKLKLYSKELSYDETFEIIALTNEKFEWTDFEHLTFYRLVHK